MVLPAINGFFQRLVPASFSFACQEGSTCQKIYSLATSLFSLSTYKALSLLVYEKFCQWYQVRAHPPQDSQIQMKVEKGIPKITAKTPLNSELIQDKDKIAAGKKEIKNEIEAENAQNITIPSRSPSGNLRDSCWTEERIDAFNKEIELIIEQEQGPNSLKPSCQQILDAAREPLIKDAMKALSAFPLENLAFSKLILTLNRQEIALFVQRLDHQSLENFWRIESSVVFSKSENDGRRKLLKFVFKSLSKEQFEFSLKNGSLSKVMEQECCAIAAAKSLTCEQLLAFAADYKLHGSLANVIKHFPKDSCLLKKIATILPHATNKLKPSLFDAFLCLKLTTSRNSIAIKSKLQSLAIFYIYKNEQAILDAKLQAIQQVTRSNSSSSIARTNSRKWEVRLPSKPIYRQESIEVPEVDWSEESLDAFILNLKGLDRDESLVRKNLSSMSEKTIRSLLKKGDIEVIFALWKIESQCVQAQSEIQQRNKRLAYIFKHLPAEQMVASRNNCDFLNILTDNLNGCSQVAAESLTLENFKILAEDYRTHSSLRFVIERMKGSSAIVPLVKVLISNISPWIEGCLTKFIQVTLRGKVEQAIRKQLLEDCRQAMVKCTNHAELMTAWAVFKMKNPQW